MAAGNPLALLELPRVNSSTLDDGAPLPLALEHAFAGQFDRLTPQARALLLAVAIQDGGAAADAWPVAETLTGTGVSADILDQRGDGGIDHRARRHGDLPASAGPLGDPAGGRPGSAASGPSSLGAGPAARRPGPIRLAPVVGRCAVRTSRWRTIWKRRPVGRAGRGAVAAAQRWLERAAALSTDRRSRQERLLAAAEAAYELGRYPDVQRLLADVRRDVLDRPTADRLAFMEGVFDDGAPGDRDGVRTLVAGAITARDAGHSGSWPCCCSPAPGAAAGGGIWATSVGWSSRPRTAFRFRRVTRGDWRSMPWPAPWRRAPTCWPGCRSGWSIRRATRDRPPCWRPPRSTWPTSTVPWCSRTERSTCCAPRDGCRRWRRCR